MGGNDLDCVVVLMAVSKPHRKAKTPWFFLSLEFCKKIIVLRTWFDHQGHQFRSIHKLPNKLPMEGMYFLALNKRLMRIPRQPDAR